MGTTVALPEIDEEIREGGKETTELDRLYHVILLDDNDHSYEYVVEMIMKIFRHTEAQAFRHAVEVDSAGLTRLLTCGLREAQGKRDQIHAYGADPRIPRCQGSMAALVEPAEA